MFLDLFFFCFKIILKSIQVCYHDDNDDDCHSLLFSLSLSLSIHCFWIWNENVLTIFPLLRSLRQSSLTSLIFANVEIIFFDDRKSINNDVFHFLIDWKKSERRKNKKKKWKKKNAFIVLAIIFPIRSFWHNSKFELKEEMKI